MSFEAFNNGGSCPHFNFVPPVRCRACGTEPLFVNCSTAGCTSTSAHAENDSLTLRIGFSHCREHLDASEVKDRIDSASQLNVSKVTVIFYKLGLSKDGQVEQLSAFASTGENFSAIIRTTFRANTNPNLKSIPSTIYNALALEPMYAMAGFVEWVRIMHSINTEGDEDWSNVVLTAHYGSCHDHLYLLRTMMNWGIEPPGFRLADSLALFKSFMKWNQHTKRASLMTKYAIRLHHVRHYVDSYARELRAAVIAVFPNPVVACYPFSSGYEDFAERTGLNMHGIRRLGFPSYLGWGELSSYLGWNEL